MERETCEVNKNPRTEKWPAVFRGPSFHANFYCCGGWSEDAGGGVESPEESGEFAAGLGRGVCFFGKEVTVTGSRSVNSKRVSDGIFTCWPCVAACTAVPPPAPTAAPIAAPLPPPASPPISAPSTVPPPITAAERFPREAPFSCTSLETTW